MSRAQRPPGDAANQETSVLLTRGRLVGYAAERMMFLFTMMHAARIVDCEISSSALDDLDGKKGTLPDEREAQFKRMRDRIERIVSDAFEQNGKPEGGPIRIFSKHVRGR